ncbi:MAG: SMC-Scp complex subunit ScpB [Armatimonadetes bacterium]|nr:SMC-Scp complex subunit ScpB [Armatimonadota bacterium]MDE2205371.1 SMC-Scp complex subunit ScpB [Armatimonadota bacterium]
MRRTDAAAPVSPEQTFVPVTEGLLFAADRPLTVEEVAAALETEPWLTEDVLRAVRRHLDSTGSGLQLLQIAGGWQLATRPEHAPVIARLSQQSAQRLSRAALETLSIVAYHAPVTIPEIEAVRGVSSGSVLKTLLDRGLIIEQGRKDAPGRPVLYVTTDEFLHYFGLATLDDLPPLPVAEATSEADTVSV